MYKIRNYTRRQAKKIGVTVRLSTNKTKKIGLIRYDKTNFIDGSISNPSSSKKNMMMGDCHSYRSLNSYCNDKTVEFFYCDNMVRVIW